LSLRAVLSIFGASGGRAVGRPDPPLFSSENAAANRPGSTDSEHRRGKYIRQKILK
jgi:hypothetical protein